LQNQGVSSIRNCADPEKGLIDKTINLKNIRAKTETVGRKLNGNVCPVGYDDT